MRQTAIALAAVFGLAAAFPAFAQTDKSGSASPDRSAASSNYTGKGESGEGGARVDHGPSENAGSKSGQPNTYRQ